MDTKQVLDLELKHKSYKIENLQNHITRFANNRNKETTTEKYTISLMKFYNYLTLNNIDEVNLSNINIIIDEYQSHLLNTTDLASISIDNYIIIVQSFCKNYLGLKMVKIKKLNSGKTGKIKYLEIEDIKGLINTIDKGNGNAEQKARDKAIIFTLFGAGLRVSELLSIKYNDNEKDFFTENNKYYINVIGKGRAKDEKDTILLSNQTANYINQYLQERDKNNKSYVYLFNSLAGNQLKRQSVNRIIKNIAKDYDKETGKNISPKVSTHTFRHSLARYLLVTKGYPISKVKDILRHSNIETTAKYLENSQDEIQDIRATIEI